MKILQIHNHYVQPGGEDTISDDEAELLGAAGHSVERLRVRNADGGFAAARSLVAAPYNVRQERAMRARLRALRPDLAHVHNTWFTLSPSIFRALAQERVPTVMTLQNFRPLCAEAKLFRDGRTCTDCVGRSPWRAVRYACYRGSVPASIVAAATIALHRRLATWDLVDRFLAPSESVKAVFVDGGFDPGRIVVRPNFVPDPGGRARSPSASRTVLYVGRLSPEKGLRVLLDAWRAASAELGDLELVIVGDGPQRAELERLAPASVSFAGYVEPGRLPEYMLAARALVFPTLWSENFGRSIIEAMAAGIPVLASDIGTPSELVGELGERWLVPPRRVPAWAVALAGLTDDDAVRAGGSRARELFEHRYAPAAGLRSLLATYAELVPE